MWKELNKLQSIEGLYNRKKPLRLLKYHCIYFFKGFLKSKYFLFVKKQNAFFQHGQKWKYSLFKWEKKNKFRNECKPGAFAMWVLAISTSPGKTFLRTLN